MVCSKTYLEMLLHVWELRQMKIAGFFGGLFACSLYYITDIEVNFMQIEMRTRVKMSKYRKTLSRLSLTRTWNPKSWETLL